MEYVRYVISTVLLLSVIAGGIMSTFVMRKNVSKTVKYFALLCLSICIYIFGYGMEIVGEDIGSMLMWNMFEYIGIPGIAVFGILLAYEYTGNGEKFDSRLTRHLFYVPMVVFFFLRATNDSHHLFYKTAEMVNNGYISVLRMTPGPLYYFGTVAIFAISILTSGLYMVTLASSSKSTRGQTWLMLVATIMPALAALMKSNDIAPYGIDLCVAALVISIALYSVGIFRHRVFDIVPVAVDRIFHHAKDAVIILDGSNNIVDSNMAAKEMLEGLGLESCRRLDEVAESMKGFIPLMEFDDVDEIGMYINDVHQYFSATRTRLYSKSDNFIGSVIVFSDITKHVLYKNHLETLAMTDGLTGVLNRRAFFERMGSEYAKSKRYRRKLSVIIFDLDNFKKINDTYGHSFGDKVLMHVAIMTKKSLRDVDILARYGGEEFIALLPETSDKDAMVTAERIRKNVALSPVDHDGNYVCVTMSIGVSGIDFDEDKHFSMEEVIKAADDALYVAKSSGKNKSVLGEIGACDDSQMAI